MILGKQQNLFASQFTLLGCQFQPVVTKKVSDDYPRRKKRFLLQVVSSSCIVTTVVGKQQGVTFP